MADKSISQDFGQQVECENEGLCLNTVGSFMCDCQAGFSEQLSESGKKLRRIKTRMNVEFGYFRTIITHLNGRKELKLSNISN